MTQEQMIQMLRNPEQRNEINFSHPSGDSSVNFNINEVDVNAETWTITTSSITCAELIAASIVFT